MKVSKIEVRNIKSIDSEKVDFKGCSAIVTAGNRVGKSTFLKSLIDRFRGETPDKILKEGEDKGFYYMELTDGAKIEWKFTDKTESFSYTTPDGVVMKTGVLSGIGTKYFGIKFDIDKFINSTPKDQNKALSKLIGLDFSDIDQRYSDAYTERTITNRKLKEVANSKVLKPDRIEKPKIDTLKKELADIRTKNAELRNGWKVDNEKHQSGIIDFNAEQEELGKKFQKTKDLYNKLTDFAGTEYQECINLDMAGKILCAGSEPEDPKPLTSLPEPEYLSESEIEQKIEKAQKDLREYDNYERLLSDYNHWVENGKKAREEANKADSKVKEIEEEKAEMIINANIPEGFTFSDGGLLYNGYYLSDSSISSSEKYIAGLKLGLMSLGKLETMHFDASFLDKKSLAEVINFADRENIQLLIERPDWDSSDKIKYDFI